MRRVLLASLALTLLSSALCARVAAPPPIHERVAAADVIVFGKVTAIEDKPVLAKRSADDEEKVEHRIALIQITDRLLGAKGLTHIRLGYTAAAPAGRRAGGGPYGSVVPTVGQEACFMLRKAYDGDFHTARGMDVIEKDSAEIALVKRCAALLEDPNAGLKSKEAEDRLLTAAMLITRFRTLPAGVDAPKMAPIDAAQNKLILDALAGADWSKRDPRQLSPLTIILRIQPQPQDGWNPPKFTDREKEYPLYAQQWLKENAAKYRIQRYVP